MLINTFLPASWTWIVLSIVVTQLKMLQYNASKGTLEQMCLFWEQIGREQISAKYECFHVEAGGTGQTSGNGIF